MKKKCNHSKESLLKLGDMAKVCLKCGEVLVDIDKQRERIVQLQDQLDRIPVFIKSIFLRP